MKEQWPRSWGDLLFTALTGEDLTPAECGHHCTSDCRRCGKYHTYTHCDECGKGYLDGEEAETYLVEEDGWTACVQCLTV
jgi:hypothetical protein